MEVTIIEWLGLIYSITSFEILREKLGTGTLDISFPISCLYPSHIFGLFINIFDYSSSIYTKVRASIFTSSADLFTSDELL